MASLDGLGEDFQGPLSERSVLPKGQYKFMIAKTERRSTKAGDGWMLVLEMEVVEGDYTNRKMWMNYNLGNSNAETVKIARQELRKLCLVCGKTEGIKDSDELLDRMFIAEVDIQAGKGGYDDSNRIKKYYDTDSVSAEDLHKRLEEGGSATTKPAPKAAPSLNGVANKPKNGKAPF